MNILPRLKTLHLKFIYGRTLNKNPNNNVNTSAEEYWKNLVEVMRLYLKIDFVIISV